MNFGFFSALYDDAKKYEDVEKYVDNWKGEKELKEIKSSNSILLLRFIYDTSRMGIKEIREYLGMPRPRFCEYYEIKIRTLEDWEYGKNPTPGRLLKLLSYTLVEDFLS